MTLHTTLASIDLGKDGMAIASCNAPSFYSDRHWRHQYGTTPLPDIIRNTGLRTPWLLLSSRDQLRCLKMIDDETGELVAYARWILPDDLTGDDSVWPEALIQRATEAETNLYKANHTSAQAATQGAGNGVNNKMTRALGGKMHALDQQTRAKYADRSFIELDYLAVRQGYQGKGLGKQLVRHGIEKARELGRHLIIMGFTEQGRALYRSIPELVYEGEVRQDCQEWEEGREEGCECVAGFWAALTS